MNRMDNLLGSDSEQPERRMIICIYQRDRLPFALSEMDLNTSTQTGARPKRSPSPALVEDEDVSDWERTGLLLSHVFV